MQVEKYGIVVELHHIDEGLNGDYDPNDSFDKPLLRFFVFQRQDGELVELDSCSYCTLLSDNLPDDLKRKAANYLLDRITHTISTGGSLKKECERLSWIDQSWLR